MPVGDFLDSLPSLMFAGVHAVFLVVGAWLMSRSRSGRSSYVPALALYVLSQVGFLGFFAGALTLKMSVLLEQMLVFGAVLWVALQQRHGTGASNVG